MEKEKKIRLFNFFYTYILNRKLSQKIEMIMTTDFKIARLVKKRVTEYSHVDIGSVYLPHHFLVLYCIHS